MSKYPYTLFLKYFVFYKHNLTNIHSPASSQFKNPLYDEKFWRQLINIVIYVKYICQKTLKLYYNSQP